MRTGRLLTASLFLVSCNAMDNSNLKHLIGDHRFEEFYEMNADMKKLSTGVAVMMNDGFPGSDDSFFRSDKKSKRAVNPGFIVNKNSALTMGEEVENSYKKTFCKDEPKYVNQPTIGVCSVFLIGPAMVATAGHCVSEMLGGSTDLASLFSGGISDLRIDPNVSLDRRWDGLEREFRLFQFNLEANSARFFWLIFDHSCDCSCGLRSIHRWNLHDFCWGPLSPCQVEW